MARASGPPPSRAVDRSASCAAMVEDMASRLAWAEEEPGRNVLGKGRGATREGAGWGMRVRRSSKRRRCAAAGRRVSMADIQSRDSDCEREREICQLLSRYDWSRLTI